MKYLKHITLFLILASWLNAMQRHAGCIGLATWAQLVNVIAPIQADHHGSVRQTIFHVLAGQPDLRAYTFPARSISLLIWQ